METDTLTAAEVAYLEQLRKRRARMVEIATIEALGTPADLDPHQIPPDSEWLGWVMRSGRGGGKTFAGMNWLNKQCVESPGLRCRIIAPTLGDGIASCVEGTDGLLKMSNYQAKFHASAPGGSVVNYPNGSKVWIVGTHSPKDVDRLRALTNIDIDVFEEAFANQQLQEAWDQAAFSRRRGKRLFVVTSTPRPHPIWKVWEEDPTVVITKATTRDNTHNDPAWVAQQEAKYKGTRLYRQEFLGEILDDVEGALWTQGDIERSRCERPEHFVKIVVGVDPPSGSGTCGIIVVGADRQGHVYVLEDLSVTDVLPNEWASVVVRASYDYGALVVAEKNNGGRMVTSTVRSADPAVPVTTEWASEGKRTRAEPISLLWEAEMQSAHICEESPGDLAKLIDQLTGWVPPGEGRVTMASPDRLDAMVWACTYLRRKTGFTGGITVPTGQMPKRAMTSTRTLR